MEILEFHYHLKIRFDAPVQGHRFTLRCIPKSDDRQRIQNVQYRVFPAQFVSRNADSFGNLYFYGAAREPHSSFEADVWGEAAVGLAACVPGGNAQADRIFCYPTVLTAADNKLREAARAWRITGNHLEQAQTVMERIGDSFCYTPGITGVQTTAAEAFALGKGVCQDYAHTMIALLRQQGIPARYVVGMLMGEGESHAWVEVEQDGCWYGFDPTNQIRTADSHIKISHGRDYSDCAVNKGRFFGSANQQQEISVVVRKKNGVEI